LLSLVGSPFIWQGDEIGMGDMVELNDRSGCRTPMQWNDEINAGFSKVPPPYLFLPVSFPFFSPSQLFFFLNKVISKGVYSYKSVNVESSRRDPASLFNFLKKLLQIRKEHRKSFGRGYMRLLGGNDGFPDACLAYIRRFPGDSKAILVVNNLSEDNGLELCLKPCHFFYLMQSSFSENKNCNAFHAKELISGDEYSCQDTVLNTVIRPRGFVWIEIEIK
jgi:glycosidase